MSDGFLKNKKTKTMENEKQEQAMLEMFQVEELEKRYEMGRWSVGASVSTSNTGTTYSGNVGYSWGTK